MNAMQKLVIRRDAARKNGKKGFTLVELIIVIAIIAALVAVLAPQYIKYLAKSRDASLESAANDILTIAKTEAALGHFTHDGTITISVAGGVNMGQVTWKESDSASASTDFKGTMLGSTTDADIAKSKSDKTYTIAIATANSVTTAEKGTTWG